jgi:rod shape-determining protein MreD
MGIRPNLALAVVTAWGLLRGSGEGLWWGLGAGLATDLFAGVPLGTFSVGLVLAGGVAGLGERQVFRTNFMMPVLMIALTTLLANLATLGILRLLGWPIYFGATMRAAILPEMAYNVGVMLILFPALAWLNRRTAGEAIGW